MWLKAYYAPGTVNVGFDTYLEKVLFNEDKSEAEIDLTYYGQNDKFILIAVMKEDADYICTLDGEEIKAECDKGAVTVEITAENRSTHKIIIRKK